MFTTMSNNLSQTMNFYASMVRQQMATDPMAGMQMLQSMNPVMALPVMLLGMPQAGMPQQQMPQCGCMPPPKPQLSGAPAGKGLTKDPPGWPAGSVQTAGGYTIVPTGKDQEFKIYGKDAKPGDKEMTKVWGDPHVEEKDGGKWDFTKNSDMLLPDGTKISINTTSQTGESYTSSLDITNGADRVNISGIDKNKPVTSDVQNDGYQFRASQDPTRDQYQLGGNADDVKWFKTKPDGTQGEVTGSHYNKDTKTYDQDLGSGAPDPGAQAKQVMKNDPSMDVNANGHGDLYNRLKSNGLSDAEATALSKSIGAKYGTPTATGGFSINEEGMKRAITDGQLHVTNDGKLGAGAGYQAGIAANGNGSLKVAADGTGDLYNALLAGGMWDGQAKQLALSIQAKYAPGKDLTQADLQRAVADGALQVTGQGKLIQGTGEPQTQQGFWVDPNMRPPTGSPAWGNQLRSEAADQFSMYGLGQGAGMQYGQMLLSDHFQTTQQGGLPQQQQQGMCGGLPLCFSGFPQAQNAVCGLGDTMLYQQMMSKNAQSLSLFGVRC